MLASQPVVAHTMSPLGELSVSSSLYRAPAWLPGGNAQTLWPFVCRAPVIRYKRERWTTPDGDFIDLDWLDAAALASAPSSPRLQAHREKAIGVVGAESSEPPLVVLFHGLEGNSRSHSSLTLMSAVATRGWRGVVVHFRGCSGEPNLLPRTYHSGDSNEADWVLRRLRLDWPAATILVVGVSLGGNVIVKWLSEQGARANDLVSAVAAVSTPFDLAAANRSLARGFNRFYAHHFLKTLVPTALRKIEQFPGLADAARVRTAKTLGDFDDAFTAPVHGFDGAADYYARCSTRRRLLEIELPTLLLNAHNDPFLPSEHLPGVVDVSPAVRLDQPLTGGHVGFVTGPFPGRLNWMASRVLEFFDQVFGA